jgi:hypothetical protein
VDPTASDLTAAVIERAAFDHVAAAPDALRVNFGSIGHVPLVLLLLALAWWRYLVDTRHVTFECRRETGMCVMSSDGPWHHEQTEVTLGEIQRSQVIELGSRDRSERTVELVTNSGAVRFGPTELCGPSRHCPESARVSRQIQRFIEQRAEPMLYISYGPFRTRVPAIVFSLLALLFGLVQLERVVVVVSSKLGRLVILDQHILGRRHYYALPLAAIATCAMDGRGTGRRRRSVVSLFGRTGGTHQLTRSGPLQGWLRRRFVRQVNEALYTTHD